MTGEANVQTHSDCDRRLGVGAKLTVLTVIQPLKTAGRAKAIPRTRDGSAELSQRPQRVEDDDNVDRFLHKRTLHGR